MKNIWVAALFLVTSAFGNEASLLKPISGEAMINEIVRLQPVSNHHFNLSAPHSCGTGKQIEFSHMAFQCQFIRSGVQEISVGVCDDQETFCKMETVSINVGKSDQKSPTVRFEKEATRFNHETQVLGFITNDWEKAVALAKSQNKLLMIDMYGTWCPPCRELEEYVFTDPKFVNATKDLIKIRMDADLKISWELRDRFKILGLPTMLIVEPTMLDEIGRIVGFHKTPTMVAWVEQQISLKSMPISWAQKKKSEITKVRVAKWHWDRNEQTEALAILQNLKSREALLVRYMAQKEIASKNGDQKGEVSNLMYLITNYRENILVGNWVRELLELDLEQGKRFTDQALQSLAWWRESDHFSVQMDLDYDAADLYEIEAEIHHFLNQTEMEKAAYLSAAVYMEQQIQHSNLKIAQGSNLRRAYYLHEGGKIKESEKIYKTLADTYPDQFVFNFRYSRNLFELEKYKKSLKYAEKAEKQSYGDNWLRTVLLKARILEKLNRKEEARKTIREAIDQVNLPETTQAWTHSRVKDLREELAKIEK